jgi:hypothetical protein
VAETAGESTPTWISFQAACELGLGQRWLKLKLKAKLIRWRARDVHPPGASLDGLWDDPERTVQPDGSAKKLIGVSDSDAGVGFDYVTVFGIEIAREDVLAQLSPIAEPETPPVESETTSPAEPETTPPSSSIELETAPSSPPVEVSKVTREQWLDRYLTEERQQALLLRHNDKLPAMREIHGVMSKDPTVDAYARARNIERHPIVRKLFPPTRRRKKKG